jgi:hypothetical protein
MQTPFKALPFGKAALLWTFAAFMIAFHAGTFCACSAPHVRKALVLFGSDGITDPAAWTKATIRV